MHVQDHAALSVGFRPFFLAATIFALVAIGLWMAILVLPLPAPALSVPPLQWHAHEMVYGYAMAVIAGFLLTAVRNWTGLPTPSGWRLAGLVALWALARVAFTLGGPGLWVAAAADLIFTALLVVAITRPVVRRRQWKQMAVLSKVGLLGILNAVFYLGALDLLPDGERIGNYGGLYLVIGLVLTMGRRLVPFFTELKMKQPAGSITSPRWLDIASLLLFVSFFINELFVRHAQTTTLVAATLFVVSAVRLAYWHRQDIWDTPLLWGLYIALWLITAAFALIAAAPILNASPYLALHAMAYGGIGLITLAMMARVSLGHTGRDVYAPPPAVFRALALLSLGAVVRVALPLLFSERYLTWVGLSQLLWIAAFGVFLWTFAPMLARPRADA